MGALRSWSIHRSEVWGSRPMDLWSRSGSAGQRGASGDDISVWAVPTLGGEPRPYLEGVAEFDWSRDGSRLAYHTPGPGDPLFVSDGGLATREPAHLHCACRAPQSLSDLGSRRGIPLLRSGLSTRQIGHLAHSSGRRNSRTDHVAPWASDLSGYVGSAHADVPGQRSRGFRTMALQYRRRAPHSSSADPGP